MVLINEYFHAGQLARTVSQVLAKDNKLDHITELNYKKSAV